MTKPLKPEVTEQGFYTFLKISVHLTGFSENELLATGMHETYYYTIMKEPDQDNVRAFFDESQALLEKYAEDEQQLIATMGTTLVPKEKFSDLAGRIILLWYTGIWTTIRTIDKKPVTSTQMVSAESYIQGLIWTAAETHPAGAKQPGYGSWSEPPLS